MALEIYLVRHGQTEENAQNILQGHIPGHLSEEGIRQVEILRDKLCTIHFDALISSDLKRCADTAAILNEPHHLPIEFDSHLRERDWGPFTGMDILKARTLIDNRAESMDSMAERATRFLERICQEYDGKRLLVVSHGLICRVIQACYYQISYRDIPRMDNAECRQITINTPWQPTINKQKNEESGATAD